MKGSEMRDRAETILTGLRLAPATFWEEAKRSGSYANRALLDDVAKLWPLMGQLVDKLNEQYDWIEQHRNHPQAEAVTDDFCLNVTAMQGVADMLDMLKEMGLAGERQAALFAGREAYHYA